MRAAAQGIALALVIAGVVPTAAHASLLTFSFNGSGVAGTLTLTYEPSTNVGAIPSTPPNSVDPVGSYRITDVTGTYSDATLNIVNAMVTGIVPLNIVSPEAGNTYAPNSFSLLPVASGINSPGGISLGLHYDNLLYPDGSPRAAFDYPFSGGIFDIYGMAFTLGDGKSVNLWSNGNVPPDGLNYGVAVTDGRTLLNYVGGVQISAVPEPSTWALMFFGFGIAGYALRRRRVSFSGIQNV